MMAVFVLPPGGSFEEHIVSLLDISFFPRVPIPSVILVHRRVTFNLKVLLGQLLVR
jgi:hypothetical protein